MTPPFPMKNYINPYRWYGAIPMGNTEYEAFAKALFIVFFDV